MKKKIISILIAALLVAAGPLSQVKASGVSSLDLQAFESVKTNEAIKVNVIRNASKASESTPTTITDNKNGTITVGYDNTEAAKVVVQVVRNGSDVKYNYYLSEGVVKEVIPLTDGNGDYVIYICKNIVGTKYSVVANSTVTLDLEDEADVYKIANIIVDYTTTNKAIKKADSLCKKLKTDTSKITKIYKYVVQNYAYDYGKVSAVKETVGYIPSIVQTFKAKMGICYDIASLYAAMCRSQGIPAKVVTGYCKTVDGLHAWNEVYDQTKEKWYIIDCTADIAYYAAKKSVSMKKSSKVYYAEEYYH